MIICAKTAELVEMPFGLWAQIGSTNHKLDVVWVQIPHGNG